MFSDSTSDLDNYSSDPNFFLAAPYVPTDEKVVEEMLDLAGVNRKDTLYDLGSGDGRIVITAAKDRDACGVGIDADPLRVADAMEYAGWVGVEYLVDFIEGDIFTADISEASVVTMYLLDSVNLELRPRLLKTLRPGTRIISHAFTMGDWEADERRTYSGASIYKWIVPAQVEGTWEWTRADGSQYRAELQQKYQKVTGSVWRDGEPVTMENAKLKGGRLTLLLQEGEDGPLELFTLRFANGQLTSATAAEDPPKAPASP